MVSDGERRNGKHDVAVNYARDAAEKNRIGRPAILDTESQTETIYNGFEGDAIPLDGNGAGRSVIGIEFNDF